jgi:hypothetical protein
VVWWSEFLVTDPEVLVRFPALPDFLRSSGSGTGSIQPGEYNWLRSRKPRLRPSGSVALTTWHSLSANFALTSPKSNGRSVGVVRSRTQTTELISSKANASVSFSEILNWALRSFRMGTDGVVRVIGGSNAATRISSQLSLRRSFKLMLTVRHRTIGCNRGKQSPAELNRRGNVSMSNYRMDKKRFRYGNCSCPVLLLLQFSAHVLSVSR